MLCNEVLDPPEPIPIEIDEATQGPFVNTNVWNYNNPVDARDLAVHSLQL